MRYAFVDADKERIWIVEADNKHVAIEAAVKAGFAEDMADFYYVLEDGAIEIFEIEKELVAKEK